MDKQFLVRTAAYFPAGTATIDVPVEYAVDLSFEERGIDDPASREAVLSYLGVRDDLDIKSVGGDEFEWLEVAFKGARKIGETMEGQALTAGHLGSRKAVRVGGYFVGYLFK